MCISLHVHANRDRAWHRGYKIRVTNAPALHRSSLVRPPFLRLELTRKGMIGLGRVEPSGDAQSGSTGAPAHGLVLPELDSDEGGSG